MWVKRSWWILRSLAVWITLGVIVMYSMPLTWYTAIVEKGCWDWAYSLSLSFRCLLFRASLLTEGFLHFSFFEFFRSSLNIDKPFLIYIWVNLLYLYWVEFCSVVTDAMVELLGGVVAINIMMIYFWARIKWSELRGTTNTIVMVLLAGLDRLSSHVL